MLLHIPQVLSKTEVATLRAELAAHNWVDGAQTSGAQAASLKHNLQFPAASPAFTGLSQRVADAMAAYRINENVNLRLNVYNLFDEEYIATLNNSGARAVLGTPRSAMLTTEFDF